MCLHAPAGTVVPPEELNTAIVTFKQSKQFSCSKVSNVSRAVGTINTAVGKVGIVSV